MGAGYSWSRTAASLIKGHLLEMGRRAAARYPSGCCTIWFRRGKSRVRCIAALSIATNVFILTALLACQGEPIDPLL
jgi:hypothetical protein